jgi:hypothetical protein
MDDCSLFMLFHQLGYITMGFVNNRWYVVKEKQGSINSSITKVCFASIEIPCTLSPMTYGILVFNRSRPLDLMMSG